MEQKGVESPQGYTTALAHIAGQLVDRSVLGHVVLFVGVILWFNNRHFSNSVLNE